MKGLEQVLCFKCVRPGGMKVFVEYVSTTVPVVHVDQGKVRVKVTRTPVLSCSLPGCEMLLVGYMDGDEAVFPDPHVTGIRRWNRPQVTP